MYHRLTSHSSETFWDSTNRTTIVRSSKVDNKFTLGLPGVTAPRGTGWEKVESDLYLLYRSLVLTGEPDGFCYAEAWHSIGNLDDGVKSDNIETLGECEYGGENCFYNEDGNSLFHFLLTKQPDVPRFVRAYYYSDKPQAMIEAMKHLISVDRMEYCANYLGYTPLHMCCIVAPPKRVENFLYYVAGKVIPQCSLREEVLGTGETALHLASFFGRVDIVRYLIASDKTLVNITTNQGRTPLHYAALVSYWAGCDWYETMSRAAKTVSALLRVDKLAASVADSNGDLPLHTACYSFFTRVCVHDYTDIVVDLLDAYPDAVHHRNNQNNIPLIILCDVAKFRDVECGCMHSVIYKILRQDPTQILTYREKKELDSGFFDTYCDKHQRNVFNVVKQLEMIIDDVLMVDA